MPFIWNDKTYWKRYKESARIEFRILFLLFMLGFIVFYFIYSQTIDFIYIVLLSILVALNIFGIINIFKQYPNANVPDSYSKRVKTLIYIAQFLLSLVGTYLATGIIFK